MGPDCHCIVPKNPVKVKVTLCPEHIVAGTKLAVPATGGAVTVIVTGAEVVPKQFDAVTV